jgi:4-hydroxy-3-methylbut-2-enyl diphosphate reductase
MKERQNGGAFGSTLSPEMLRFRYMAAEATSAQKINLRRPDVMEAVQAQVEEHYRSEVVERIRASGNRIEAGGLTIKLAKEFGFCYGVERAIDLAYAARKVFQNQPLYILGEIIHNPDVNDQLRAMGIHFLSGREKDTDISQLRAGDVVIIPAFGTDITTRKQLEEKGCRFVDTTCGDVMSVWKRVRQYSREKFTSIIHGKASHEETKATSSQADIGNGGHYLVVYSIDETRYVCDYIVQGGDREAFLRKFAGAHSPGFDPNLHLNAIGIANQTTMLRGETEEVQRLLRDAMLRRYGAGHLDQHFRFFDTICGATQDRQDALKQLLAGHLDLLIVIGGYNSSNTSHLAEIGEAVLPTYFIKNASKMVSAERIIHYNLHQKQEQESRCWLPAGTCTIGVTAGASCPNNLIEDVIRRIFELRNIPPAQYFAS